MYIFFEKCKFFKTFLRFSKQLLNRCQPILPFSLIEIQGQRVETAHLLAGGGVA